MVETVSQDCCRQYIRSSRCVHVSSIFQQCKDSNVGRDQKEARGDLRLPRHGGGGGGGGKGGGFGISLTYCYCTVIGKTYLEGPAPRR